MIYAFKETLDHEYKFSFTFTFQKLGADIDKVDFLAEIALVQLPNAGDERILFRSAAGNPLVDFFKM